MREEELQLVYLKAGEMHYADRPSLVMTVLGSCLSVTMHDRRTGTGGICHGLLPACRDRSPCPVGCSRGFRFVDCSIRHMLRLFEKAGSRRRDIEVKCFGGADMFTERIEKKGLLSVGRQNIKAAEETLTGEGITIVKQDVGGLSGRKVFFYTHTGEVLLKRLSAAACREHHEALPPAVLASKGSGHD
jgi:chemotaxis protein CheD